MNLRTIQRKMNARDGSGYKNIREIYSDVKLVFENAMKYNDEKNNIENLTKSLLDKFEKKWLHLLPEFAEVVMCFSKLLTFHWDE